MMVFAFFLLALTGRHLLPYLVSLRGLLVNGILNLAAPFVLFLRLNWGSIGTVKRWGLLMGLIVSYGFTIPGSLQALRTIFG